MPHVPTSEFHEKNFFIIKHLLSLYERDDTARRVFGSWLRAESRHEEEVA